MDKFVRLSEDALHQRHAPDCKGFQFGQHHCDCLVSVVIALQAELDGRFGWRVVPDREFRQAISVLTPTGRKLRIVDYADGRVRVKVVQGAPMVLQELYLAGVGKDVVISVVPEGWTRPPAEERTDYIIVYNEPHVPGQHYFPKRYLPDIPLAQQWVTSRKRARRFSTEAGAKTVTIELAGKVPPGSLSVTGVTATQLENDEA
jgi:hypothetical protein